ncbi:MAG: ABC transporter ATP-binding protein [Alphaproteobacteria bacterium]
MNAPETHRTTRDSTTYALAKRLWRDHMRTHMPRVAAAILCMAIAAAATAALAKLMEPVLDDIFIKKDRALLHVVAFSVLAVFVIKGLSTYVESMLMNWVGFRIIADFQIRMFAHLMRADLVFFHDNHSGGLVSRFIYDAHVLRNALADVFTGMGKDVLTLVFLLVLMFHQDASLALISFVVFPIAVLPIIKIGQRIRRVAGRTQAEIGQFSSLLEEAFQGARYVKSFGMERHETARATDAVNRIFKLVFKANATRSALHPVMEILGGFAVVSIIVYGGLQVVDGQSTPGKFFSFITALILAYEPMKKLANLNAKLQEGLSAVQRIFAMLDVEPMIVDRPNATTLAVPRGTIEFDRVDFGYVPGRNALKGVSLTVPAGKTVALVGPSGAGKTSVLNLIPRFYDIERGRVAIDGQDVRDVTLASLRANIGLVSQETNLFDDTVRANIAYGRPEASDEDIVTAARRAGAHDFIAALPHGYATRVGGQGVKLSGGQRQRLSIARAMLKNAPILLLDEATSALDANTERLVQAALKDLMRGRTTLIVAHRLSTIADADIIYVMDDGRILESGSHSELMARGGAYARLYARQISEEAPAAQ